MILARIGHGPCYYDWNEIFAGVSINNIALVMVGAWLEQSKTYFSFCYSFFLFRTTLLLKPKNDNVII